ncbi:unnamed protein product [Heterobilharzia americana]|nr:unnamed protein product [Heterobilharzia americana]
MTTEYSRRVLLPIDGSEHSKRAVNWYLKEFSRPDDLAYFFHAVEPHYSKSILSDVHETHHEFTTNLDRNIKNYAELGKILGEHLYKDLQNSNIKLEYIMQIGTKPGELIVSAAKERSVDVILIGNRGLGALRRTFLGSVSEYVLHHCNIPFIIVPLLRVNHILRVDEVSYILSFYLSLSLSEY